MKTFRIKFCWATRLPIHIVFEGKDKLLTNTFTLVSGTSQKDIIDKLKGTDPKIISQINSIIEC